MIEVLKKISIGAINGVRKAFRDNDAEKLRGRIYGIVRSVKWEDGEFGRYVKFIGEFVAFNADGKQFTAPVLYLPEAAQTKLATIAETGSWEFAVDLYTVPQGKSYAWRFVWPVEPAQHDPLKHILARTIEASKPVEVPEPSKHEGDTSKKKHDKK